MLGVCIIARLAGMEKTSGACLNPCPRVYVDGIFDLFHAGHIQFLRNARKVGGDSATLIVGVITDEAAKWKRPPVIPHVQRVEMIRNCKLVDEVVLRPPLVITKKFIDSLKITHVVHGDDDLQKEFFRVPRDLGIMAYVPYTRAPPFAVSTTELISRIRARPDLGDAASA